MQIDVRAEPSEYLWFGPLQEFMFPPREDIHKAHLRPASLPSGSILKPLLFHHFFPPCNFTFQAPFFFLLLLPGS